MLFSSISFLYYFLPITLIVYFLVPKCAKNGTLLLASLVFYAWGEPKYVLLMIASVLVGYIAGRIIEGSDEKKAKLVLVVSIALCLLSLFYFKYVDFFIANVDLATGLSIPLLRIALPIGISFYTFQIISYIVDVYRKDTPAQKNIINLAAYITMFPQLIAGPIVRYKDIEEKLTGRTVSADHISKGITYFIVGLSKKILIANVLGECVDVFRASGQKSVLFYWIYAIAFTLHIYFDFSGYSDMAIGLGSILGFDFPTNFNYPYISKSITEYWRRWHMTLGGWFRDYVYIPLGGNRVSKIKWYRNILVVWLLTGFWHGADWNFIIWGLYFAIILVFEKAVLLKLLSKNNIFAHLYVIILMILGSVIFNADGLGGLLTDLKGLFGIMDIPFSNEETFYYFRNYLVVMAMGIIGATPIPRKIVERIKGPAAKTTVESIKGSAAKATVDSIVLKSIALLETIALIVLLVVCTAFLIDGSFNPFLYFRF